MRFDKNSSTGLRGAVALLLIASAGGGAYAFARRDAAPEKAAAPAAVAPVVTRDALTAATTPCQSRAPEPKAEKPAEPALPSGEDRAALLDLRRLAKQRTPSAESRAAQDRLDKIARAALAEADKPKDLVAERAALTRAFLATLDRDAKKPIRARLDDLVTKPGARTGDTVYTVKSGDRLIGIARAHKVNWSFLKRMNGLKTDAIRVGQKLRIPTGTVELAVFKTDFLLIATLDGAYLKAWDVGTGREDRTPESSFKIAERIEKPTWYAPDGKVYPFGEKENILGTRWLGFERTEQFSGFGIHGTAFPETIGTESSAGCIRMRNEDVEEVYDLVPEGTIVTIIR